MTIEEMWCWIENDKGCWVWTANVINRGYGRVRFEGKQWLVHRLFWVVFNGEIPEGLDVLHSCDNRPCCNPEHLFVGTNSDNMVDMYTKGRGPDFSGERNNSAKLTKDQISVIRTDPRPSGQIAPLYGVSRKYINKIRNREIWRSI